MNSLTITARVGPDGVLRVQLPPEFANCEVRVTIEKIHMRSDSLEEHRKFIEQIAGSWDGDLKRPEQLPLEEHDPL